MREYIFTIRVPEDEREVFLATISGEDDCAVLAAEKALRAKVDGWNACDPDWKPSRIEVEPERGVYVR